jgi:hypothetical protein
MPPLSTIRCTLISPRHVLVNEPPASIAILGNDAFLASAPALPVQLMQAALAAGFDAVVPVSLGDELVAGETLRLAQLSGRRPVVQCACPFAQAQLCKRDSQLDAIAIPVVPGAVALARALRLERDSAVHITYIGACPGAQDPAIDLQVLPAKFLRGLRERGILLEEQPEVFVDRLPPDRRRFLSRPGGVPRTELVESLLRRKVVSLGGRSNPLLAIADALFDGGVTLIDPAGAYDCACSGADAERSTAEGRDAVEQLEPVRASAPIFDAPPRLDLRPTLQVAQPTGAAVVSAPPLQPTTAEPTSGQSDAHSSWSTSQPLPSTRARPAGGVSTGDAAAQAAQRGTKSRATPEMLAAVQATSPLRAPSLEREVPLLQHGDALVDTHQPAPELLRSGRGIVDDRVQTPD